MKMNEIKQKAKGIGVSPGKMRKTELIRTIQQSEGYDPCFQTAKKSCDQQLCCWRKDCLNM